MLDVLEYSSNLLVLDIIQLLEYHHRRDDQNDRHGKLKHHQRASDDTTPHSQRDFTLQNFNRLKSGKVKKMTDYLKHILFCLLIIFTLHLTTLTPSANSAVNQTFATRNDFNAVFPGLLVEGFENNLALEDFRYFFTGPLNSETVNISRESGDILFPTGSIMDGISIDNIPAPGSDNEMILFTAYLNQVSDVVGSAEWEDDLEITFSSHDVYAIAIDFSAGPHINTDMLITIFNNQGYARSRASIWDFKGTELIDFQ